MALCRLLSTILSVSLQAFAARAFADISPVYRIAHPSFQFASTKATHNNRRLPFCDVGGQHQRHAVALSVAQGIFTNDDLNGLTKSTSDLTSVVLRLSYDGSLFSGWTAPTSQGDPLQKKALTRRQRRSRTQLLDSLKPGMTRSIENEIKHQMAKLYGNIDPDRIQIEASSRTDAGAHARGLVVQFYCLKEEYDEEISINIPGKRLPHPSSSTDSSCFMPIPFQGDMSRIAYTLNRMLPQDTRVRGIAPVPTLQSDRRPFHPSLDSVGKTYTYRLTVGNYRDPLAARNSWHIDTASLDTDAISEACGVLEGCHDFLAFSSVLRGEERAPNSTTCTLSSVTMKQLEPSLADDVGMELNGRGLTYEIKVCGDRFLYKMMRHLVGALASVGAGKRTVDDIKSILHSQDVSLRTFECAPARGLVLQHVDYGEGVDFDWYPF